MEAQGEDEPTISNDEPDESIDDSHANSIEMKVISPACRRAIEARVVEDRKGFYEGFMADAAFRNFAEELAAHLQREQASLEKKLMADIPVLTPQEIAVRPFASGHSIIMTDSLVADTLQMSNALVLFAR